MSTIQIIGLVLILIIIFLIIFLFKKIKLYIIQIFYGKYSYKYVSRFKHYTNTSPFPRCYKDDLIHHIIMFKKRDKNSKIYKTDNIIQFDNIPFLTDYNKFTAIKGKPQCFNAFIIDNDEVRVIGYNQSKFDTDILTLYYFINNVFFMGEYIINNITKINTENISKIILNKYFKQSIENSNSFYIENTNDTTIYFGDNGFSLFIKYFYLKNTQINDYIDKYLETTYF